MDGRQSGCYAPDPGPPSRKGRGAGLAFALPARMLDRPPMEPPPAPAPDSEPAMEMAPEGVRSRRRGLAAFLLALVPGLAAVWSVPWFVTQDGPAHLYNAH